MALQPNGADIAVLPMRVDSTLQANGISLKQRDERDDRVARRHSKEML